jgi:hypothetical protein
MKMCPAARTRARLMRAMLIFHGLAIIILLPGWGFLIYALFLGPALTVPLSWIAILEERFVKLRQQNAPPILHQVLISVMYGTFVAAAIFFPNGGDGPPIRSVAMLFAPDLDLDLSSDLFALTGWSAVAIMSITLVILVIDAVWTPDRDRSE